MAFHGTITQYLEGKVKALETELERMREDNERLWKQGGDGWVNSGRLWAFIRSKGLQGEAADYVKRLAESED